MPKGQGREVTVLIDSIASAVVSDIFIWLIYVL
jgi:hypothetical protein